MKPINIIFKNTCRELKYPLLSHVFWITLAITTLLSIINIYGLQARAESAYDLYIKTYNTYKEDGLDVEEMLKSPVNVIAEGDWLNIDNPVGYHFNEAISAIQLLQNENIITQTLEWMSFVFFPLIFALYGIYIATYDYKHQTIKIKAVQIKWSNIITTKMLASYIYTVVTILTTLFISYIVGRWFYNNLIRNVPSDFIQSTLPQDKNLIIQIIFSIITSLFFSTVGFTLGILFRRHVIPVVIFFVYHLIVPVLWKYDIRNMISVIAHELFEFNGRFQLFNPTPMPNSIAIGILSFFWILMIFVSYILFSRQSKYTVS